jgi:hypothetical protein
MIHQDYEHESAKDYIYLLEEQERLKAEFYRELDRSEAIIKIMENPIDYADKQVADIRNITPEGIQLGSVVPFESDKERS